MRFESDLPVELEIKSTTITVNLERHQLHYYYALLYGIYGPPYKKAWVRKTRRKTKRGGR